MTVEKKEKTVDIELTPQQKNIQAHIQSLTTRLDEGSAKFKKLEMLIWGIYPFIVGSVFIANLLN